MGVISEARSPRGRREVLNIVVFDDPEEVVKGFGSMVQMSEEYLDVLSMVVTLAGRDSGGMQLSTF